MLPTYTQVATLQGISPNNIFATVTSEVLIPIPSATVLFIPILPFDAATNLDSTATSYITPQTYIVIIIASLLSGSYIN